MKNFSVKVNNKEYWVSRSVAVITFIFKEKNGTLYSLIEKRGKGSADNQGKWCVPGGYVDFDETLEEACAREVLEECGFIIDINKLKFIKINSSPDEEHQNINVHYVYFADKDENYKINRAKGGEKNEVADIKWIKVGKLENNNLYVDIYNIMTYDWAFDHDKRIIEHLSQFYCLKYSEEN